MFFQKLSSDAWIMEKWKRWTDYSVTELLHSKSSEKDSLNSEIKIKIKGQSSRQCVLYVNAVIWYSMGHLHLNKIFSTLLKYRSSVYKCIMVVSCCGWWKTETHTPQPHPWTFRRNVRCFQRANSLHFRLLVHRENPPVSTFLDLCPRLLIVESSNGPLHKWTYSTWCKTCYNLKQLQ